MDGDPQAIRRLATGLAGRAADLRAEADRLVARTDAVGWLGAAGDALRERARVRAADLRRSAGLHDEAAEALLDHARRVARTHALVEQAEHRLLRLLALAGRADEAA